MLSTRNKIIISIAVIILAVMLVIVVGKKEKIDTHNTILTATVVEGKNTWEVHKCLEEQLVTVVLNGKVQSKKEFLVTNVETPIMKLGSTKSVVGTNVDSLKDYSKSTWVVSLEDAVKQVKWYETLGYTVVMKAETQKFIEVYMKNDKSEYKRILITDGKLSVADVKEYIFKSIDSYIF